MSALRSLSREARSRRSRPRLILITLGVGIIIALLVARPAMRRWGAMQSGNYLAAARAALERQDFMTALEAVQQAARVTPQDPEMLRTGVQVLAGLEAAPEEILTTLNQLEAMGGMTPKMHLIRAQAHLQRGDITAVEQVLNTLSEVDRHSWDAVEVEASLLLRQGRAAEAGVRLQASTGAADSPDAAFRRAVLELAASSDSTVRNQARQTIWQTARRAGKDQPLAITLLCRNAALSATEAAELLNLMNQNTAPGLRQAVLAQVFRLTPEQKQSLIQAEASRIADLPVEHQVSFLLFLARQQAPQEVLAFLRNHGRTLSIQSPADFTNLVLEAYAKLKDWQTVSQKLQTPAAAHLNRTTRSLWTACATHALNPGSPSVLSDLQIAYEAAGRGKDRAASTRVADTAMNLGHAAFAGACYEQTASLPMPPAERIHLLERACHAFAESRDTAALRRVVRTLADESPGHDENTYRAEYLDILYGIDLELIARRLESRAVSQAVDATNRAHERLLQGMILSRMGQLKKLPAALEGLEKAIAWTPGERAVIAGLLAKAGEPARAFQLVEKLPESLLLPEEADMATAAR